MGFRGFPRERLPGEATPTITRPRDRLREGGRSQSRGEVAQGLKEPEQWRTRQQPTGWAVGAGRRPRGRRVWGWRARGPSVRICGRRAVALRASDGVGDLGQSVPRGLGTRQKLAPVERAPGRERPRLGQCGSKRRVELCFWAGGGSALGPRDPRGGGAHTGDRTAAGHRARCLEQTRPPALAGRARLQRLGSPCR